MSRPEIQPMELKYCERCGALWLRPGGSARVYCPACAAFVAQLPPTSSRGDASAGAEARECLQ